MKADGLGGAYQEAAHEHQEAHGQVEPFHPSHLIPILKEQKSHSLLFTQQLHTQLFYYQHNYFL